MPGTPQDRPAPDEVMAAALARAADGPGPGCLDAEELAAYYARALDARDLARHDAHVASCLACQERLAAMVRSEPKPVAASSWWTAWLAPRRLLWATPAIMAILVAAVWIAARPGSQPLPESESMLAQRIGRPATTPADTERETVEQLAVEPLAPAPPVGGRARSTRRDESSPAATAPPGAPAAGRAEVAAPPAGQVAAAEGSVAKRERAVATDERRLAEEKASPAEAQMAAEPRTRGTGLAGQSFAVAPAPVLVQTPGGVVVWRIDAGGTVARSDDGGAAWRHQTTTDVTLLAGSAPNDRVCWVAGRSGAVLRTIDGETWQPVASPAVVDLVQVEATDALRAVVTAADGRRFETADGGQTWTVR